MVYIFFVQPGYMKTFDNEISIMQSVADLKEKIREKCGIPLEQQVLLINGGEPLDSQKNLCSYMAGTDTNPIYLFSTNYDVQKLDILKNLNYDDADLKQRLCDCLTLPVSLSTVRTRALIAQDFFNVAKLQLEFCESMVHEQHLQQQGWSAVIANLEDIVLEFKKRWELFLKMYEDFIADRDTYDNFLLSFEEDKKILQRIPVIDTLLDSQKEPLDGSKISEITSSTSETEPSKEISLYEWISSSDSKNSLDELYDLCKSNLKKFERDIMPSLEKQISDTLQSAEKPERKEIEGLGKRLFDLEELLRKIKKYVEHQSDMAQSFLQNQNSVAHLKDTSILPDLCATHKQQMDLIRHCHQKLMEDRNRIVRAKYELSKSLCARIGWVQNVEDKLWELDSLLVYFHEHLQRLRKHLEVFQQLHLAPVTYMNAVVEVVRRRSFSQIFLLWASDLACQQLTIHNEEVTRRKEFSAQFEGHFLNALFPGMSDVPPPFAIEAPPMFDAKLPVIGEEDVEKLRREVPDFAENLTLPDMNHVVQFFTGKCSVKGKEDKVDDAQAVEEKLIQAVSDVGLASNLDKNLLKATGSETCLVSAPGLPNLKDDKGCESETDTEEFEKVGQSPLELTFPQGVPAGAVPKITETQDASTSTEVQNQIILPPKKPPRSFRASSSAQQSFETAGADPAAQQRTPSISATENSFTNIKNLSLDSIDELSSIKNFTSTTDSCFNSHCNQAVLLTSAGSLQLSDVTTMSLSRGANAASHYQGLLLGRSSKSVSPQSPREQLQQQQQQLLDFVTDEFYIDESLPSSVGTGNSQGSEFIRQLDTANIVVAMLQDNLQISRSEHDKLKATFEKLSTIATLATSNLRSDLDEFRAQFASESSVLRRQYEDLGGSWETLLLQMDRNEKEIVECMRRESDGEKERFRYNLLEKEDTIRRLEEDNRAVEDRILLTCQQLKCLEEELAKQNVDSTSKIDDLLKHLHEKDLDREKCLKELSEKLKIEHRAELDNIKSRFKLMTMERSPSLTSLEKEKSGDFTSLPGHSSNLLVQMTENFELDKEKAVAEERRKWEKVLEEKIEELEQRYEEERQLLGQDVARRVSEDKDKQIDVLRERERNLNLEIVKYKTTIQQLAEYQEENKESDLFEQMALLKRENEELHEELAKMRNVAMTASVAVYEGKLESVSGPSSPDMSRSEIVSSRTRRRLNIDSCKKGDIVLVLWDPGQQNFRVFQESRHSYFLHSSALERLGLTISDGKPNKTHCTGEVIGKEFCQTLKSDNRFNLPKSTTFFLVKVDPVHPLLTGSSSSSSKDLPQSPPLTAEPTSGGDVSGSDGEFTRIAEEEVAARNIEKILAEDSGIVDCVEQAAAVLEESDRFQPWYSSQENKDKTLVELATKDSEEIATLRRENVWLQGELAQLKSEREALMSASVAACERKTDATTSPLEASPPQSDLTRSEIVSSTRSHRLNIDSCKPGDIVLLLWDQAHENFKVLQESKHTFFLHSECLDKLGLIISEGKPNRTHCTGQVVDKEYCQSRKSENRYKVPKGAKFFRVKVKSIGPVHGMRHAPSMSASQSVIATLIEEATPLEAERDLTASDQQPIEQSDGRDQLERGRSDSSDTARIDSEDNPTNPTSDEIVQKHFTEDSGIEEATVATENNSDRCKGDSPKEMVEQSTYVSTNWLEAMFRSMFSK